MKLSAEETTGRLLGAHILADGAGDVIQTAIMAIKHRATVDEIADTFHPYLTMARAVKLAAQASPKMSNISHAAPPDENRSSSSPRLKNSRLYCHWIDHHAYITIQDNTDYTTR